jgi:hypothetical protein
MSKARINRILCNAAVRAAAGAHNLGANRFPRNEASKIISIAVNFLKQKSRRPAATAFSYQHLQIQIKKLI